MTFSASASRSVVVVGPDPTEVGGMATVVGQMLGLNWGEGWTVRHAGLTPCGAAGESTVARVRRHLKHWREFARELRADLPTVVHIHTCSGFSFYRSALDAWIARRCGAKVVLHVHGAQFDEFCKSARAVARRVIRGVLESVDRVVALSDSWREVLQGAAPRANVVVIPNAVEIGPTTNRAGRAGACRFLLLAKMDEWKGIKDLLLACASVQYSGVAFELVLAGPSGSAGDATTLPRGIAELELSDRVVYVGSVAGARKAELLAWADVYVQPSHHEGLPIAVLEAMASGLPVIATTVGALPEVIDEGVQGHLVAPGRPDRLAAAMTKAARSPTRIEMGEAGRRRIEERFSLSGFRDGLVAMYESIHSMKWSEARKARSVVPTALLRTGVTGTEVERVTSYKTRVTNYPLPSTNCG